MNIAVIGGGNIGTLLAADCAHRGHTVTLCASDARCWDGAIDVLDGEDRLLYSVKLAGVTSDVAQAVEDADLIWVTHPLNHLKSVADAMLPVVRPGQIIGVTPGACAEFFFSEHVRRGCVLFGLQRVHSIARLKKRARSVRQLGRRDELFLAALPAGETDHAAKIVETLLDIPVTTLPSYLVETLTPSNPILHTTRLRTMFADWHPGIAYDHNILFYEEWNDEASRLLFACDAEVQALCRALPFELDGVVSLPVYYEQDTPEKLTYKISHIPAFHGLTSPMREATPGSWVPDFSSRYFVADFSYGLSSIRHIARLAQVPVPHIDEVLSWYERTAGSRAAHIVPDSFDEFRALYRGDC